MKVKVPALQTESTSPNTGLRRVLFAGERLDASSPRHAQRHPWYVVLWLTGVDYFSTLGYQPGIALLAAGALAPVATTLLIAVTLFCALPIYSQVAARSYVGQGSIAMLEHLLEGWKAKLLVLVLLGFAATDFVITMTLSAADAAQHAIHNPILHPYLGDARMSTTLSLLALLAVVFLFGFSEAISVAAFVAMPYIGLNLVVLVRGLMEITHHPEYLPRWKLDLAGHGDWTAIMLASAIIFPKLALGLSGFETGVSVMPLIRGDGTDPAKAVPRVRILNTRKLLATAAVIMSVMLMLSSFVTTLLIPIEAYQVGGMAEGRAIAYLAHRMLGGWFGTLYDISTILILWFAGASAMAGLLHLIPRFLPRFGMAPQWVAYPRPLVLLLFVVCVIVTLVFKADVEAQGGAYATGVLVLMLSAAIASALALRREERRLFSAYCWLVSAIFAYTLLDNVHERPDGIIIATIFIVVILLFSAFSRMQRSTELRVSAVNFVDDESSHLWAEMTNKKVHLVPVRSQTAAAHKRKMTEIREHYRVDGKFAFVHVTLLDNRSEFFAPLQIKVSREGDKYLVEAGQAIAIANTIAYLSELLDPISIFLGLTRLNLLTQALKYLFLGEGETGLMVYMILQRYWEWTPEDDIRPLIFLMSD